VKTLKGEPLAKGFIEGSVCLYKENVMTAAAKYALDPDRINAEIKRLRSGIAKTIKELKAVYAKASRSLSPTEADIFYAHIMILEDASFIKRIEDLVHARKINSEWALIETIEDYKKSFSELPGDYIRERAEDLNDIAKRIIQNLGYKHTGFICSGCHSPAAIVAAEHLTTSLISSLGKKPAAGVLVEKGSPVSHGAIMAKALGVPVIIRVEGLMPLIGCGTPVIIDADAGRVYIRPGEKTRLKYKKTAGRKKPFKKLEDGFLLTADGEKIRLLVNASGIGDIEKGLSKGVCDVGLFRTEFLFTGRETGPSAEEQAVIYAEVIKAVKGQAAFRLLDAGTDKEMPYLNLPPQANPDLGLRGVRLYKRYPEILADQAGALIAARGNKHIKIIVPMVSAIDEFIEVKKLFLENLPETSKNPGEHGHDIEFGCMIELPSAVHTLESFVRECSFLSIGTNDLIQYLVGADRGNDYLGELSNPLQPAVARVLNIIIEKTRGSGREVVVCGEMAGSPETAGLLVGLGYRNLSINPAGIEETARHLRKKTIKKMQSLPLSMLRAG
jgi:phosphoenolpyruvate-protein phosphotransferase (PTS system enzyme I)